MGEGSLPPALTVRRPRGEHLTDKESHDQTLREIFAPHGEEALKNHIAQNIRAANAMAGKFDIEDPRTIIDRLEAGETLDDLIYELLPHSEDGE